MNVTISAVESLNTAVAGVISRMATGVLMTLFLAYVVNDLGLVPVLFQGILGYVIIFAPLAMSAYLAWRGSDMSEPQIRAWFYAFAGVMGVSLSMIFAVFTSASIVQALLGTTVSFGALAGWGYFTRRDLRSWGAFLFAGVIGLIVASIINIWVGSTALQMTLNLLAIVIFLGLTAYDMNRIRDSFWGADVVEVRRQQWWGALSLYINFINIFTSLLNLLGDRK